MKTSSRLIVMVAALLGPAACATTQLGASGSMVTGSAGAEGNAQGAARQLTRCNAPIGTIALVESQPADLAQMAHWWGGHTSPVPLIRLMPAQSGCFNVVESGQGVARMTEERELAEGGMLAAGRQYGSRSDGCR